jgi:small subunit ribosomal protein S18
MADETKAPEQSASSERSSSSDRPRSDGPRPGGDRPRFGGGGRGPGGPPREGGGRKFFRRKKVCKFCVERIEDINYKDYRLLGQFVAESGKIVPRRSNRHATSLCCRLREEQAKKQLRAASCEPLPIARRFCSKLTARSS